MYDIVIEVCSQYSSKNKFGDKYRVVPVIGILYIIIMSTHAEEIYDKFLWFDMGVVHIGRI